MIDYEVIRLPVIEEIIVTNMIKNIVNMLSSGNSLLNIYDIGTQEHRIYNWCLYEMKYILKHIGNNINRLLPITKLNKLIMTKLYWIPADKFEEFLSTYPEQV